MNRNIVRVAVIASLVACGWVVYDQVSSQLAESPDYETSGDAARSPTDSRIEIPETLASPPAVPTPVVIPAATRYTVAPNAIARGQEPSDDPISTESAHAVPHGYRATASTGSLASAAAALGQYETSTTDGDAIGPNKMGRGGLNGARGAAVLASGTEETGSSGRYGAEPPADDSDEMTVESDAGPDARADGEPGLDGDRLSSPRRFSPAAPLSLEPQLNSTSEQPHTSSLPSRAGSLRPATDSIPPAAHVANDVAIDAGTRFDSAEGTGRPGSKRLEGPQTPQIAVQKFAPAEIQVGKECVFEIKVRNTGEVAAQNVVVRDEIPQGTRLVSTKPEAVRTADGRVVWELGTLGAGDQTSVETHLMPTDEGEIGSVATVKFESQASVRTKSTRPELAVRLTMESQQVMIGQDVIIKIEISNPGTGNATGVMLLENVPENVSHAAGQSLEFELGTLAPGETREMDLVLRTEKAGKVINTLTARGDASLSVEESVEFEVIAPELKVDITGPKRRFLDRKATYEVSVSNPGTAPALEVELITRLPEGMKFIEANNSGHYDAATHAVYWSLEELPPKQSGAVELVAMPVTTGEQTLRIEGSAQQGLKDKTQKSLSVKGVAAIMFEVVDLNDPIVVGEETTYEIRVVNQGSKEATDIQIVALLPVGLQATSAAGPSGHELRGERVIFEPLRQLAPKADTTYRIKAKGLRDGDQRIRVQLTTGEMKKAVTKEVSTRVYKDE